MITRESFKDDWAQFKREGLGFGITLVLVIVVLLVINHYLGQAELLQSQSRELLEVSTTTLANIEQERSDLISSQPRYRRLVERHVIGPEDRLAWRDLLETSAVQHQINKLSYSLAARTPLSFSPAASTGGESEVPSGAFKRYYARMSLLARFENEHGFVDLLDDVAEKARAILLTRSCHIKRIGGQEAVEKGKLEAECLLDWVTFERSIGNGQAAPVGDM